MFVTAKKKVAKVEKTKTKKQKNISSLIQIKNVNVTRQSPQGTAKRPLIIPF